jgi:membrane protein
VTEVVRLTYRGWRDHRTVRLGAALAYYGLFAVVPLLSVTVVVADLLVSFDAAVAFVATPLAELAGSEPDEVTALLSERLAGVEGPAGLGLLGIVTLLVSASLLFVAFQDALNVIWDVPYRSGLQQTIRRRLLAFGVVLVTSGVVIVSLAVQTVLTWLRDAVPDGYTAIAATTELVSRITPVVVTAVALALLYLLLPLTEVEPRAAAVGGAVTAVVMALGVFATGWVLQRSASVSVQGAAGSVFVLLTGLYVQSQIVLGGAEYVRVLTERWTPGAAPRMVRARPSLRRVNHG